MKKFGLLALCVLLVSCGSEPNTGRNNDISPAQSELQAKALAGDREAQFELGNSFCCGERGSLDTNEAIRWWCLAALQSHPGALGALKKHDPGKTCPI